MCSIITHIITCCFKSWCILSPQLYLLHDWWGPRLRRKTQPYLFARQFPLTLIQKSFIFKTTSSVKSTLSSSPWYYKLGVYATSIAWHRAINLFTHFPQTSPQWFRFLFPISSLSASLSTSSMWMSTFFIIIIRLQETFVKTSSIAAFSSVCFNSSIMYL